MVRRAEQDSIGAFANAPYGAMGRRQFLRLASPEKIAWETLECENLPSKIGGTYGTLVGCEFGMSPQPLEP